ncbi:Uncharacterized conserved protein YbcC [Pseudomonas syringae pv. actinidiae]|uniref:Uncharacterized conserved protein YbcC n=1 Tax=Pseudomonas syringae pv. actinidiae TaxID=103796 RepID=A0A2V0QFZ7_PSESF|nr:Uncharacterized conserved protein YbcC [Pseudomonas syringae pv. actinidiae]
MSSERRRPEPRVRFRSDSRAPARSSWVPNASVANCGPQNAIREFIDSDVFSRKLVDAEQAV